MKTKFFTFLLAVSASIGTLFADGIKIDDLYYNLNAADNTAEVTYNPGSSMFHYSNLTNVNIPASVTYNDTAYSVISIGERAFQYSLKLKSVTIPNSVTNIGDYAFYYDALLTSITIPNSVTNIGGLAFEGCSGLTSITIPNSVISIGIQAFSGCSGLTSVTIPNSVTSIGNHAFSGCSGLTSVTIGNSVTSVGAAVFEDCSGLPVIDNIRYADTYLIEVIDKTLSSYTIIDGTRYIGSGAFSGCTGLNSMTIPYSVTSVGSSAFRDCSGLTSITIPNSVTSIGDGAFYNCSGLTSPIYNTHVFAFIPSSYTGVYTIPDSIESIAGYAFYGCTGLTSVTIPNSATSIGNRAFEGCSGLTSMTIPNNVTSIGDDAFYQCRSLTSIVFSNSLTSIGKYAFTGCSSLTSLTIPNSVISIENYAFAYCSGLTSITCKAIIPPTLGAAVFYGVSKYIPLFIPEESVSEYNAAEQWNEFDVRAIATYYTVTFKDWDGTILKTEQVEEGQSATAPANPTRDGYTFTGWDNDFSNVHSDLIVTAQYTQNTPSITYYTVTFKDWDGTILKTEQVEEGQSATAPANPTREGYTFTGWDKEFDNVQSDLIVTAQYQKNEDIAVTNVSLNKKTLQLIVGQNETLIASILPSNATNMNVTWTSSNIATATISTTGIVTAVAEGTTTITCKTEDGNFEAKCYVVVSEANSGYDYSYEPTQASSIEFVASQLSYEESPESGVVYVVLENQQYQLNLMYFGALVNGSLPKGNYEVSSSAQNRTFYYSVGGDETSDYGSFLATNFDSDGNYSTAYYIIAGDVKIEDNGYHANLVSANGSDIEVTYNISEGLEDISVSTNATKILHNGQILILRGDRIYTMTGQEVR